MAASILFLVKIFIPSLLISIAIRRLAPALGLVGSDLNATIAILIPSIVVAIVLSVRGWKSTSSNS
ncbi:MAG: hypothetical protein EAZ61_04465 [Oscillatoriales cyanobacterium]|jgi:hypothetical protein|nr:MAG: hypothetical protein EAZ61_04465 [Oscillatoriales cyanobacterium]